MSEQVRGGGVGAEEATVAGVISQLEREGWSVVRQPGPGQLPEQIADFRPELVAERDGKHVVIEVKSRRSPPDLDMVSLAERVAELSDWRLDFVYVVGEPEVVDLEQLLQRSMDAGALAETAPEAAFLLAWSAAEGLLHQVAAARGIDSSHPGQLLAALASLGILEHDEHDELRTAMQLRNALAHGFRTVDVTPVAVRQLTGLARVIAQRLPPVTQRAG